MAAVPATIGQAWLVPDMFSNLPLGIVDIIFSPGAKMSTEFPELPKFVKSVAMSRLSDAATDI